MWPHACTHLKCRTFAKRDWADHHMAIFQVYDAESERNRLVQAGVLPALRISNSIRVPLEALRL